MKLMACSVAMLLVSCAPTQQIQGYSMSWHCNTTYCYDHVSPNSWGGNGNFSSESDCVGWEAIFLNSAGYNGGGSVTSCTAHY